MTWEVLCKCSGNVLIGLYIYAHWSKLEKKKKKKFRSNFK